MPVWFCMPFEATSASSLWVRLFQTGTRGCLLPKAGSTSVFTISVTGLTLRVLALPYLMMAETLERMVGEGHRALRLLDPDHEGQAAQLVKCDAMIARLKGELAKAQAAVRRSADMTGDPVLRRVGLERLTEPRDLVEGNEACGEAGEGFVDVGASLVRTGRRRKRLNHAWVRSTTQR